MKENYKDNAVVYMQPTEYDVEDNEKSFIYHFINVCINLTIF